MSKQIAVSREVLEKLVANIIELDAATKGQITELQQAMETVNSKISANGVLPIADLDNELLTINLGFEPSSVQFFASANCAAWLETYGTETLSETRTFARGDRITIPTHGNTLVITNNGFVFAKAMITNTNIRGAMSGASYIAWR